MSHIVLGRLTDQSLKMLWLRIFLFALVYFAVSTLANQHMPNKERLLNNMHTDYIQHTIKKLARRNEQIAERVSKLPALIKRAVIESPRSNSVETPMGAAGRILILKRSESSSSSESSSESSSSSCSSERSSPESKSRSKSKSKSGEKEHNYGPHYPYPYGQLYGYHGGYGSP